ncbi:interferon-induced protein 44-like isoform X2 [Denticeps clupeoides]|uniref:interferon-induced protein 44-like isoform X2 n=1 Tax=Denticeps clupeoides TaxID=299321 RepID=UPI0010A44DE3|nr:interferon-induced protein 44-like isoform X2 [Denticeps clupeoides]
MKRHFSEQGSLPFYTVNVVQFSGLIFWQSSFCLFNMEYLFPSFKFTKHLEDTEQLAGKEVTLSCEVNKYGASAQWFHGDKQITNSTKVTMVQKSRRFDLRINNVQESDEGFYRIKLQRYGEVVESTAKVAVQEKIVISRYFQDVRVNGGQEVILKCEVNREDVTAEWKKGDQLLTTGRNVVMEQRGREFILKIKQAHSSDTGLYTCLVKSGREEVKCSAEVAVQEFDKEWRILNFSIQNRNKLEAELIQFKPKLEPLRILLYGPVGSGKSSFINSIDVLFNGQMNTASLADSAGTGYSFTKKYKTHRIEVKGRSKVLPFVFNDVMGLEDKKQDNKPEGVAPEDIISALKGHIPDDYMFRPSAPLTEEQKSYNSDPSPTDKVHCLVCVLPADKITFMTDDVFSKMKQIRETASDMGDTGTFWSESGCAQTTSSLQRCRHPGIPQVTMVTRVDVACPVVGSNLGKIYYSIKIKEKMQECSNRLGVPMNCIFPVKNYHEETKLVLEVDVLILDALFHIVNFANNYAAKHMGI